MRLKIKDWDADPACGQRCQRLQPLVFRSAVIHTFRSNHDATVVRFGYQARRNNQESHGSGARLDVTISQCFLSNTSHHERISRVQGIRNSRSDRRTIFTPRGDSRRGMLGIYARFRLRRQRPRGRWHPIRRYANSMARVTGSRATRISIGSTYLSRKRAFVLSCPRAKPVSYPISSRF